MSRTIIAVTFMLAATLFIQGTTAQLCQQPSDCTTAKYCCGYMNSTAASTSIAFMCAPNTTASFVCLTTGQTYATDCGTALPVMCTSASQKLATCYSQAGYSAIMAAAKASAQVSANTTTTNTNASASVSQSDFVCTGQSSAFYRTFSAAVVATFAVVSLAF